LLAAMSREAGNAALLGDVAVRGRPGAEAPGGPPEFNHPPLHATRRDPTEAKKGGVVVPFPGPAGRGGPAANTGYRPARVLLPGTGPESLGARYGMTDVPPPGGTCSGFEIAHVKNLVTQIRSVVTDRLGRASRNRSVARGGGRRAALRHRRPSRSAYSCRAVAWTTASPC